MIDGNAGSGASDAIKSGQVHSLVWCSTGFELSSDSSACSVAALCRTIQATAEELRPRVAFLVMQYVAHCLQNRLYECTVTRLTHPTYPTSFAQYRGPGRALGQVLTHHDDHAQDQQLHHSFTRILCNTDVPSYITLCRMAGTG